MTGEPLPRQGVFLDGNRVTPGTEKCVCGPEHAVVDDIGVEMGGGRHFTKIQAEAITEEFKSIKKAVEDAIPPPPEPDHRCPCCAHGWSDNA